MVRISFSTKEVDRINYRGKMVLFIQYKGKYETEFRPLLL